MDPSLAQMIVLINIAVIGSVAGLVGYRMHLKNKRQLAQDQTAAIADVQRDMEDLRDDLTRQIGELQDRVDYAERALAQEKAARLNPPRG